MTRSEEIEADLADIYPRDRDQLDAFWRGDMSLRRLWVLVSQFPPSSRTVRNGGWTQAEHLIADAVEALNWANFQRAGAKGKKPQPYKRPGTKQATADKPNGKKKSMSVAEFDAFIGATSAPQAS